ncbi:MAG: hypothetical protein WD851_13160 [Pirellulales bacterium]
MSPTPLFLPASRRSAFAIGAFSALCTLGCNPPGPRIDPAMLASYREQFQSSTELAAPVTVAEVRATLEKAEDPAATTPVVLIGQVGGVPNPLEETQPDFPWQTGEATFFLVDQEVASKLAAHLESQGPDHQDCPFCARAIAKSVDSMAAISFRGKDGKPVRIGAQTLFQLEPNDVVVVEGDATLLAGKMLAVDARRIHVKQ